MDRISPLTYTFVITVTPWADTRYCDFANATSPDVTKSRVDHAHGVRTVIRFLNDVLEQQANIHDADVFDSFDLFFEEFKGGFKQHKWFDQHRLITRHHLDFEDAVPDDVNLLDVLEYIADKTASSAARHPNHRIMCPSLSDELLERAFQNTVQLIKDNLTVVSR